MTLAGETAAPMPEPGVAPAPPGPGATPTAPPPPPGPGVAPPFPAPPSEGRAGRIWLSAGIAAAVAMLCCGGGAVAVLGIGLTTTQALTEQARTQVGQYLDALRDEDYSLAYSYICDQEQDSTTRRDFIDDMADQPVLDSYRLGELNAYSAELLMPADLTYSGGQQVRVQFILVQDTSTAQLEVCGTQG
jgi:hypothetical protein